MSTPVQIILASNSPRRRELLALTGWRFIVSPADIDETPNLKEQPEQYVRRLAHGKATACTYSIKGVILAADTIVVDRNQILGKPVDRVDAERMLKQLRNRSHQVMTAVSLFNPATGKIAQEICITNVPMRNYSDEEISAYVEGGDPLDKAGAYAIQHTGFHPVENFNGCFASVMGLPLCHVKRMAASFGLYSPDDLPERCMHLNNYDCPIFRHIESGAVIG